MHELRWTIGLAARIAMTVMVGAAQAQVTDHTKPSSSEYIRLPEYCQDLLSPQYNDPWYGRQQWRPRMGETIDHMHHYCYGLIAVIRAQRFGRPLQERNHYWTRVEAETTYVIDRMTPEFVLAPEIFHRRATAYSNLKRVNEAVADYRASIKAKPDYFPAYIGLAELYQKHGQRDLAIKTVQEGLSQAPNAKPLQSLLKELGQPTESAGGKGLREEHGMGERTKGVGAVGTAPENVKK